ncbi:hypothetical protein PV325_000715 [Microctonus aethiopoides]|uniref:N-acetylgalactosaminide beta-1,3-galactosyltransferase n=1 Tax=Microctonus aethiopoides TaxID=144406 RepID=A0AA39CAM6_9HYME|nr:hypothetical protein PV325_000715 [Microctonus aethiopoides]KAK0160990.1 hypothetical protein PV328_008331 [Microctonus aethiopoides]
MFTNKNITMLWLMFLFTISFSFDTSNIVVVVLSQHEGYHAAHAKLLKDKIIEETLAFDQNLPKFVLTHEEHLNGSWTYFPLIPILCSRFPKAEWFLFCSDNTAIKFQELVKLLDNYNASKEYWLGHALYDKDPTIIHHFADQPKKLKYPNVASGFAISNTLMKLLNNRLKIHGVPETDFSIDASYEFANYIFNKGNGTRLTHVPEFCGFFTANCVTYPKGFHACTNSVSRGKIYVAVKTYDANHQSRIPIISKTWLKHVKNYGLFSNVEDKKLKNVIVVPNTKLGHCAKTYAILQHVDKILQSQRIDWLVIADDDTIFSIARLTRLLTCYNPNNPVALGERYGFRVIHNDGYEYLTGGAGLVLSAPLVHRIVKSAACKCPRSTTPDDMFIFGICLNKVGVRPTHSPLFHQARPIDYSMDYLSSQEPVSFHKFWMIDPIQVYEQWFKEADYMLQSTWQHTEL